MLQINLCLSFSSVFVKGIRFNTYHYRFAFHRNAHNY